MLNSAPQTKEKTPINITGMLGEPNPKGEDNLPIINGMMMKSVLMDRNVNQRLGKVIIRSKNVIESHYSKTQEKKHARDNTNREQM